MLGGHWLAASALLTPVKPLNRRRGRIAGKPKADVPRSITTPAHPSRAPGRLAPSVGCRSSGQKVGGFLLSHRASASGQLSRGTLLNSERTNRLRGLGQAWRRSPVAGSRTFSRSASSHHSCSCWRGHLGPSSHPHYNGTTQTLHFPGQSRITRPCSTRHAKRRYLP